MTDPSTFGRRLVYAALRIALVATTPPELLILITPFVDQLIEYAEELAKRQ